MQLLVIDDDPIFADLARLLTIDTLVADVVVATTVAEAEEALAAGPDVVVCNHDLQGADAEQLWPALLAHPHALVWSADPVAVVRARRFGLDAVAKHDGVGAVKELLDRAAGPAG